MSIKNILTTYTCIWVATCTTKTSPNRNFLTTYTCIWVATELLLTLAEWLGDSLLIHVYGLQLNINVCMSIIYILTTYTCIWVATCTTKTSPNRNFLTTYTCIWVATELLLTLAEWLGDSLLIHVYGLQQMSLCL